MHTSFDRNFFEQVGLDSGALTMLGAVVHQFSEPGEYRGTVRKNEQILATFYVSADKSCAVAQANIDLAMLAGNTGDPAGCCSGEPQHRFIVHPKGYVVFHLTGGVGGYSVLVRKADDDPNLKSYDTRELQPGDTFSATIIRPGDYRITNEHSRATAEATVAYPTIGAKAYRPPAPIEVDADKGAIDPERILLHPGQGLNFHIKVPSRIRIKLIRPNDGPTKREAVGRPGWNKHVLPRP